MRGWRGTKRERAQRWRHMRKLMERYGTDSPHEATIRLFKDITADMRRNVAKAKRRAKRKARQKN
jgi:hypothetical protein